MVTSSKRTYASTLPLQELLETSAPDPVEGHCRPMPLPGIPKHSQASLAQSLMGHCSFLLVLAKQKLLFVPSKSLFPSPV